MRHLKRFKLLCFAGILVFLMPVASFAESQIFLKDGRVVKVKNFWREEGAVKYESFGGVVGIPLDEVDHIITPDMGAFEDAKNEGTVKAYEEFIKQHPRSEYADQARQRIKALEFEDVKRMNSGPVYLAYIRRNPNSIYLDEAKGMAEILVFQDAVRNHQGEKYKEYLDIYPDGRYAAAAGKALHLLRYQALIKADSISEIEAFLREHPESAFRQQLEDRVAFLLSTSEAKAEARAKRDQEAKARKLQEMEAARKRSRWIRFFSFAALIVLAVSAGLFFFSKKRHAVRVSPEPDLEAPESESEIKEAPVETKGPIRYEDLIGVPRHDDTRALPDPGRVQKPGAPASLPAPGGESGLSEGEGEEDEASPFLQRHADAKASPGETPIILGDSSGADAAGEAHPSDSEVDLSDHETKFKLDLKEVSHEAGSPDAADGPAEEDVDLSEGDFPELFEDDPARKRRGGEFKEG